MFWKFKISYRTIGALKSHSIRFQQNPLSPGIPNRELEAFVLVVMDSWLNFGDMIYKMDCDQHVYSRMSDKLLLDIYLLLNI